MKYWCFLKVINSSCKNFCRVALPRNGHFPPSGISCLQRWPLSAQPWSLSLCGMRCHSNRSSAVSSQNTCSRKSQILRPHRHSCHNCTIFWWPSSTLSCFRCSVLSCSQSWHSIYLRESCPDFLTPVYIDLDIDLEDELRRVALNLGTQYTCWFPYSFIYWSWHWPQRCIIHSCSQPWHPIYMRGTGLGCLGFIAQEQTTVYRRQGDHFQQTNVDHQKSTCVATFDSDEDDVIVFWSFILGLGVKNSKKYCYEGVIKKICLWNMKCLYQNEEGERQKKKLLDSKIASQWWARDSILGRDRRVRVLRYKTWQFPIDGLGGDISLNNHHLLFRCARICIRGFCK